MHFEAAAAICSSINWMKQDKAQNCGLQTEKWSGFLFLQSICKFPSKSIHSKSIFPQFPPRSTIPFKFCSFQVRQSNKCQMRNSDCDDFFAKRVFLCPFKTSEIFVTGVLHSAVSDVSPKVCTVVTLV